MLEIVLALLGGYLVGDSIKKNVKLEDGGTTGAGSFASGGETKKKYTYVPQEEIASMTTFNDVDFENKDILNGAYIKGKRKFEDGGENMGNGGKTGEFDNIIKENRISEKEINLIKRRLNADSKDKSVENIVQHIWDEKPYLTEDQNKKGLEYLISHWKTPTGKERTNNPFRYREEEVLDTFESMQLSGFHDNSNYKQKPFYVPLYIVNGKEGSFEYYVDNKGINIVGEQGLEVSESYKAGGKTKKIVNIKQKGSQSGNPTKKLDLKHKAKPVGWRYKGNIYRKPSEKHIKEQLLLSPDERDIYFERRKDHSDINPKEKI